MPRSGHGLIEKFAAHGIAPTGSASWDRPGRDEHLQRFRNVDICLDPIPHGGGVSVWESLYMGRPVVTRLGRGIAREPRRDPFRRGNVRLVPPPMTINMSTSPRDRRRERLAAIRHALPDLIADRCGPAAYTRAVEEAYRTM